MKSLKELAKRAGAKKKQHKKALEIVKKWKEPKQDTLLNELHEQAFERIECLNCANCCKTTGALLKERDISRISKYLKLKPGDFTKQYLRIDEDGDYVFQSLPCPFLASDNYCSIYDVRPQACAEYPHTQQKKQRRLLKLHTKNAAICPAVFDVLERLERITL